MRYVCLQGDPGDGGYFGPPGIDGVVVSTGCITAVIQQVQVIAA